MLCHIKRLESKKERNAKKSERKEKTKKKMKVEKKRRKLLDVMKPGLDRCWWPELRRWMWSELCAMPDEDVKKQTLALKRLLDLTCKRVLPGLVQDKFAFKWSLTAKETEHCTHKQREVHVRLYVQKSGMKGMRSDEECILDSDDVCGLEDVMRMKLILLYRMFRRLMSGDPLELDLESHGVDMQLAKTCLDKSCVLKTSVTLSKHGSVEDMIEKLALAGYDVSGVMKALD